MSTALLASALVVASPSAARADVSCAGEGPPIYPSHPGFAPASVGAIQPTALVTLAASPLDALGLGRDADAREGDPVALVGDRSAPAVRLDRARFGLCGVADGLVYRLVYEPFDHLERAHGDASAWGRFTDAQVGWAMAPWMVLSLGVGKVPAGRGREQPVGALALPALPASTVALAPDRRAGVTLGVDLGPTRAALGAYLGGRTLDLDRPGGLLLVGRGELVPWGPVGARPSPEAGAWTDRARVSTGLVGAYRNSAGSSGYLVGADVALAWRRLFVQGELLYADRWPLERPTTTPGLLGRRLGAWLEALVELRPPIVSVAARAEYLDEDVQHGGPGRYVALSAGVNVVVPGPLVELQAMYTRRLRVVAPDRDDDVVLLALTIER